MSRTFQQTEDAVSCAGMAACSGATAHTSGVTLGLNENGTPGAGQGNVTLPAQLTRACLWFTTVTNQPNATSWPAGDWVVPINVTVKNNFMYLEEVHICRVGTDGANNCASKGSVGSQTGLGMQLNSTGVKTITISGSAQTADAGDRIYIVCVLRNAHNSQSQAIQVKADQVVTTPL